MPQENLTVAGARSSGTDSGAQHVSPLVEVLATVCFVWYLAVTLVCAIGYTQIRRHYRRPAPPALCTADPSTPPPHVTVIRPIKGLEPNLYDCLAATFHQEYPRDRLTIYFCISSRSDPSLPVLEQLLRDFPEHDVHIFVEEEDPALQEEHINETLGPNPKIRNMSRAYREAKGDIVWILDCNVWIGRGVAGRMVDLLCGYGGQRKNKFVHQLPLVVDTDGDFSPEAAGEEAERLLNPSPRPGSPCGSSSVSAHGYSSHHARPNPTGLLSTSGGRLEELFMASAHAKFYTAINTVLVAPCIVGKSNMFRRSHLNYLTARISNEHNQGIDHFSSNICEDHLIGDLLWRKKVPEEERGERWGKHALLPHDPAIQPTAGMSVREYVARRVRWLRVRKFTVALATLVEPGTESLLCSLYGAFALTHLPFLTRLLRIPVGDLRAGLLFWLASVSLWAHVDWTLYRRLHASASIEVDERTPEFARPPPRGRTRRPFAAWLAAWLGRECLALPVWLWAVWGGVTVSWRGRRFWVGLDMRVHEVVGKGRGRERGKRRRD